MSEPMILTFAEISFALRASGDRADHLRSRLSIHPDAGSDAVVAAGVSSLLARGLATLGGPDTTTSDQVTPGELVAGVTVGLSSHTTHTEVIGWIVDEPAVLHVLSGPYVRLMLSPASHGQFMVQLTDPSQPLAMDVDRFLDLCTVGQGEAAVGIRSESVATESLPAIDVTAAIARDASGLWHVSDGTTVADGRPLTRGGVSAFLANVLRQPVIAG
jgi:hypothetical protein